MKRLFTLLAALMLTVTASFAQQNFYFWGKNGNVSIEPVSEVDSLTFSVGSWLFQISKPVNLAATTSSFQGSAKVAFNDKVKSIDVTPEVGICYSDVNRTPNYDDFKKKLGSAMQDYSFTIMNVASGTTYYYRTYVKLLDEVYYSAVNSITTMGEKPQNTLINGHEFIDLGLPSGLLWAKTNVGASSSSDDGDYFAWGETEPTSYYAWSTYKWGDDNMTKYNSSDGKTTLDSEDDAVCQILQSLKNFIISVIGLGSQVTKVQVVTLSKVLTATLSSSLFRVSAVTISSATMVGSVSFGLVRSARAPPATALASASAVTKSTRRPTTGVTMGSLSAQSQKDKAG